MSTGAALVEIGQDEVLTGEAVALDVQPVGFLLRLAGAAIDIAVAVALYVVFVLVMVWSAGSGLDASVFPILSIVFFVVVAVALPTVVETATRGRSLGKLAVGGRIVRADGGASGLRQALIRALAGVLEIWMTFGAVAALVGAFTPRSQRLGDLLAGTYSQRTRAAHLPVFQPAVPPALAGWADLTDVAALPAPLARRVAQFVRQAEQLEPPARARVAATLAREAAAFVSPVPAADPELFVRAVAAVRFERELRAVQARDARARSLVR